MANNRPQIYGDQNFWNRRIQRSMHLSHNKRFEFSQHVLTDWFFLMYWQSTKPLLLDLLVDGRFCMSNTRLVYPTEF